MNGIISAVILVCAIGLIAGIGLSIASVVMAVPKDEKADTHRTGVRPFGRGGAARLLVGQVQRHATYPIVPQ